jgi:hypothetical protein
VAAAGFVNVSPSFNPHAILLNSGFVVRICIAGVMVKRLNPLTSFALLPTPWKFQYHRILVQPATWISMVSISVAAGEASVPAM